MTERRKRWAILAGYWVAQAAVLLFAYLLFVSATADGAWRVPKLSDFSEILSDNGYAQVIVIAIAVLTALQFLLILPVHLGLPRRMRGKSVYLSLAAAGACIALIVVGFVAAVSELFVLYDLVPQRDWSWTTLALGLLMSWSVFTVLLVRYANRSNLDNDELLTRVARIVFQGTVVETAALIPIDVMVRRKTDCYCWAGSFWALILSGAVGFVVAGPAIFLPLLARRPRRRRANCCEWCGYDRSGIAASGPCPECGRTPLEEPV